MIELFLCEAKRLIPQPGEMYRFIEDTKCSECRQLAEIARGPRPTAIDLAAWKNNPEITAILLVNAIAFPFSAETALCGKVFNDRKGRFEDGYPIYTSIIESYDFRNRLLRTKNSLYLLTQGTK